MRFSLPAGRQLPVVTVAALMMVVVALCSAGSASPSPASAATGSRSAQAPRAVGQILHHTGAYEVYSGRELNAMLSRGMTLVLDHPPTMRSVEATAHGSKARYIDSLIFVINGGVSGLNPMSSPTSCWHATTRGCVITPRDIARIHKAVIPELRRAKRDPRIVGFYTVDDFIGNTLKLEVDIHHWIAQAGLHLPTICGFGGRLDVPNSRDFMGNVQNFAHDVIGYGKAAQYGELQNYSPQACDMVILFPFGPQAFNQHDATAFAAGTDWKMSKAVWPCGRKKCTLMNFYKYALGRRGWTSKTPLIGAPQAFGYNLRRNGGQRFIWPAPNSKQLAGETAAFCAGGAQSIVAFSWHNMDAGSSSPYKNKSLRNGVTAGVKACNSIWHHHRAAVAK